MARTDDPASDGPRNALGILHRRLDELRIREHLRRTERDLRRSEPPGLTPEQRRRREQVLDDLRDYWRAGEFPTNRRRPVRTPMFVGANGVPCAMASLLLQDGREELVQEIQASDPTVRLEEVEEGPLVEWVEANGLTMAEAARIQPSYDQAVRFATDCGPVSCTLAWAAASLVGTAVAGTSEWVGYRLANGAFPDNALKRRATLGYLTVLNLLIGPLVALLTVALFP